MILETTLRLIEEKGGTKDVNLREIAKNVGCAHTNLYNYFDSLDDIYWEALAQVLLKMIDYSDRTITDESEPEAKFYSFLLNIIDFSMGHPGWYRLIWQESIGGTPSSQINNILSLPGSGFEAAIAKASNNKLSEEKASFIGDILFTYLHGELSKWINNRSYRNSPEETKVKIFSNLKYLFGLLMQKEADSL